MGSTPSSGAAIAGRTRFRIGFPQNKSQQRAGNPILEIRSLQAEIPNLQSVKSELTISSVSKTHPKREEELLGVKARLPKPPTIIPSSLLARKLEADIAVSMEREAKGRADSGSSTMLRLPQSADLTRHAAVATAHRGSRPGNRRRPGLSAGFFRYLDSAAG
jgi:hypothetical protein